MHLLNNYLNTTMQKIKNNRQLHAEKTRLNKELLQLEQKIYSNWNALKESLQPAAIAKETLVSVIKHQTAKNMQDDSIAKSTFTYGISLIAKKFAEKAGEKLEKIFKKKAS
jgi:hypothetical protein